jgi:hypothetical protein
MSSNPFLNDALEAKDDFIKANENKISEISFQRSDITKIFPEEIDRQKLNELINKVNAETEANKQYKVIEDNVKEYSGVVVKLLKGMVLK